MPYCPTALKLQDDNYITDDIIYQFFVTQGNSNEVINLRVSNKIFSLPAVLYFIAIGLRIWKECMLSTTLQLESKRKLNVPFLLQKKRIVSHNLSFCSCCITASLPFASSLVQPKDCAGVSVWKPVPPGNLTLAVTVSGQRQNQFNSLPIESGKVA